MSHRIIALILAGGQGQRLGGGCPKQYTQVDDRSVVGITMQRFQRHPMVQDICVVCHPTWASFVCDEAKRLGITKLCATPAAGESSTQSLFSGLRHLMHSMAQEEWANVGIMVHDAVRPMLSQQLITDNLEVYRACGNAITAVQSQEAYLASADGHTSCELIPRNALWRAQTPMTFTLQLLATMMLRAQQMGVKQSQSLVTLMHRVMPDETLHLAAGSEQNFKLTYPTDMDWLRALIIKTSKE